MHREGGAKVLTIIGAVILILGIVLAALPTIARGGGGEGQPDIKVYSIDSFMTAVYKVYGNPNLGFWVAKTVIKNTGSGPLYNVKITYKIEGLTDWSEPKEYKLVPPGGAVVDLYYPILSHPPNIQTTTPGKLYVKIEYKTKPDGEPVTETKTKPINILGSHDFIFSGLPPEENTGSFRDINSNYPLLAAWVTPKDPVVERYADMANKLTGSGAGATLGDKEALAFLEAMWDFSVYNGITYQTEPTAFWTGKWAQWIKYPRDVIRDRSGTCVDTAIFIASVAMSQGLDAYLVIMPGHVAPIVKLPSGQLIPIESTLLGSKASFQQAIETGFKVVQEAFQGPHLVVYIAEMQSAGIVPPELPELPPNVLEQWGYTMPGMGGGVGGGQAPGGGQGGRGAVPQPQPPANMKTIANPFGDLPWSISVPADWEASKDSYSNAYEVDLNSPDGAILIAIVWSRSHSANALKSGFESTFNQYYNGYQVKADNTNGALGNIPAEIVVYSLGTGDIAIARYTNVQGYGLAVVYLVNQAAVSQETINAVEQIVQTFRVGG
ncbi:cysteine protease [Infirmifilum sp. SLHALR2]